MVTHLKLSSILSDGMVLQRNKKVTIWGQCGARQAVQISWLGRTYSSESDHNGQWQVEVDEMEAGGPHNMTITVDGETVKVIQDILIGEVWVLGGQSNMQLPIARTLDLLADEVKDVELPHIRQFTVPQAYHFHGPQEELPQSQWIKAVGQDVMQFSGAGFYFARELYRTYGVPIGLILTAIGGTPIEAWTSEPTLRKLGGFEELLDQLKDDAYVAATIKQDEERAGQWYRTLQENDLGIQHQWQNDPGNPSEWHDFEFPAWWKGSELEHVRGAVWFRKEIDVPESMLQGDAKLMMGTIVDADDTYVNGQHVGSTPYRYPPRRYKVPSGLLRPGKNVITVRVITTHNAGSFIPGHPYKLVAGGQELELSGIWQYRVGAKIGQLAPQTFFQYMPAGVYNSMMAPLRHYKMQGVLWYQGESNSGQPEGYNRKFRALVQDWRALWGGEPFPFIFTQLPNFDGDTGPKVDEPSTWPDMREEQRRGLTVPNTAMAVTIDIGEHNDLHPQDKKTLGERLALCARKLAYGEDIVYSGPLYASMSTVGETVHLRFDHVGSGLVARGGELGGFTICGPDGVFVPAQAEIVGDTVIVSSEHVREPQHVRYAWADNPADANLYNREGLPASPFTTEEQNK